MGKILGITGTPGTGKKSVAPLVAARLGWACTGLNDLAKKEEVIRGRNGEVDPEKLASAVARLSNENGVLYGHLLPLVIGRSMIRSVVVLRCEPMTLKSRLEARGYPLRKVRENVEAELIGLISSESFRVFGTKSLELDTTRSTPEESARRILGMKARKGKAEGPIDWTLGYGSAAKLESLLSG